MPIESGEQVFSVSDKNHHTFCGISDLFQIQISNILEHTSNFFVLGNGEIGDKARQLIQKESDILAAGLQVPKTIILADDVLKYMCECLKIDIGTNMHTQFYTKYHIGKLPHELLHITKLIGQYLEWERLAIRSSACQDSAGTGIYDTKFLTEFNHSKDPYISALEKVTPKNIIYTILEIYNSYFSDEGYEYRRQTHASDGFGVIIQPIIGQDIAKAHDYPEWGTIFEPVLSGNGYTSTLKNNIPTLTVVPGIGGGVEGAGVNGITNHIVEEIGFDIFFVLQRLGISHDSAL
ncbi:hypothetical protein MK079_04450, partial [Candidatus Gracilibacteria bacterium]|nr:hypothetical protein [Candidatus Gracilibacteria bacterium]